MTQRLTDDRRRAEYSLSPSVKNPFDRDPVLIPQLFVGGQPWHRRRGTVGRLVLATVLVIVMIVVVRHFSAETVLRSIARMSPR